MKTEPLIPYYLTALELKGTSPRARQVIQSYLNRFAQVYPELPVTTAPIFKWLGNVGNSKGTRLKARKVLSAFYRWVCASYEVDNPMPGVQVPKRKAKNGIHPMTIEEPLDPRRITSADGMALEVEDRIAAKVAALIQGTTPFAPYEAGPQAPELTTKQAIADYLVECRKGAKPKAESSITWELVILNRLMEQHPSLPMDGNILGRFIGTAISRKHRHTYSRILVTFYGTLAKLYRWKRLGVFNPIDEMDRVSYERPEDPPLQADELERIIDSLQTQNKDVRLCLLLLMTTGLRPVEVANLTPDNFLDTRVQVKGKTRLRLVELIPALAAELKTLTKSGKLFTGLLKKKGQTDSVHYWTTQVMNAANVRDGKGGGRLFRHTFACWLYTETGDLKLVKDVLGHTNLDMSIHYAKARMSKTAAAPLWYELIKTAATCHKQETVSATKAIASLIEGKQGSPAKDAKGSPAKDEKDPPAKDEQEREAYIRQYGTDEERKKLPGKFRLDTAAQRRMI